MTLNHMCFIWASNRVLKSERAVHLVAIKAENLMWCTCSRDSESNHLFSSPYVAGTQLSLITSQPCVFYGGGGGGGGGEGGSVLDRALPKMARQLPTRIYTSQRFSTLLQSTASDKTASGVVAIYWLGGHLHIWPPPPPPPPAQPRRTSHARTLMNK